MNLLGNEIYISLLLDDHTYSSLQLLESQGTPTVGIQFYDGRFESTVPNIRVRYQSFFSLLGYPPELTYTNPFLACYAMQLTRARDGTNGIAYFNFDRPSMFDPKETVEETIQDAITSMRLVDEEGEIRTTDVSASFVNGQPVSLQVTHVMPTAESWERFIRFMDRYAAASELGFDGGATPAQKSSDPNPPRSQAV